MELLVEDVSHGYGALRVLDGVSLSIASGEIVALLGPSGCGKSTLLGIAGGMVAPLAGRVRLRGEAPAACLNPLTYVFQDFALLPWRDVAGNVALPLNRIQAFGDETVPARMMAPVVNMTGHVVRKRIGERV